tara:strand:- start:1372 stop:2133 length:762 start_codon:yes stop_codon:yes gene_type:complete
MGWLRKFVGSWFSQDKYHTNNAVAHGLEWAFTSDQLVSLFECLVASRFNLPDQILSADERQQLIHCIQRKRSGETLSKAEFPELKNEQAIRRVGRWISNVSRSDLGHIPLDADHIIPASFLCPEKTKSKITATFRALGYGDDIEHNLKLCEFMRQFNLRRFEELFPYTVGPCIVIINADISLEDVSLVPRATTMFHYNPSLGLVAFPDIHIAIVRKGPDAIARIELADVMDIELMENRLRASGWETKNMSIKY